MVNARSVSPLGPRSRPRTPSARVARAALALVSSLAASTARAQHAPAAPPVAAPPPTCDSVALRTPVRTADDTIFVSLDSAVRAPLPRPLAEALLAAIVARIELPQPLALPVYENADTSRAAQERPAFARPALSAEVRLTLRRRDGGGTRLAATLVARSLADAVDAAVLRAVQAVDSAEGPTLPWEGKRAAERVAFLAVGTGRGRTPGVHRPLVAVRTPLYRHERGVRPDGNRVGPLYPPELKAAGVEGRARLDFVVTEAGRVDPRTLRVRSFTHPAFAAAVAEFLRRAAYQPGLVAGCPVKMLVSQPFEFQLVR